LVPPSNLEIKMSEHSYLLLLKSKLYGKSNFLKLNDYGIASKPSTLCRHKHTVSGEQLQSKRGSRTRSTS